MDWPFQALGTAASQGHHFLSMLYFVCELCHPYDGQNLPHQQDPELARGMLCECRYSRDWLLEPLAPPVTPSSLTAWQLESSSKANRAWTPFGSVVYQQEHHDARPRVDVSSMAEQVPARLGCPWYCRCHR